MTKATPKTSTTPATFHFPLPTDFTAILKDAEKRGEILQPYGLQKLCDNAACIITNQNYQFLTNHKIAHEKAKRRIALRDERYAMMFEPSQIPSAGLDFTADEDPDYVNSLGEYFDKDRKGPDQ